VEAVPRRTLLITTIVVGIVLGTLLSLGTGEWWRHAVLAASPPHFGVSDSTNLGNDAGYYVSVLPWLDALQNRTLILVLAALGVVALLYALIGSLRIRRGRLRAGDYARAHLGALLACLALVITWGAVLDPAEIVGGFHGVVDQAALSVRIPGAAVVAAVGVVTTLISLVWAWRDRPNLIVAGWTALLLSVVAGYFVIPGFVRASARADGGDLRTHRAALERTAFGLDGLDSTAPPRFASSEAAVRTIPLWDPAHVAIAGSAPVTAVALRPPRAEDRGAVWMIAPTNAPATTTAPAPPAPPVRLALETDSGLALTAMPLRSARLLFGPGLAGAVTLPADSAPVHGDGAGDGIPLVGAWRRFAIAWTTQDWSLARGESGGKRLLWRRDVTDRLERLAPFAHFGAPAPLLRDGALWWFSWGYLSDEAFPLVRPLPWRDDATRFLRAGLIGAVSVGTGETHVWLAPGYDSLTAAWARRFKPLIEPAERLPADVRAQLTYPVELFTIATSQLLRASADSTAQTGWIARPREPFQLGGPGAPGEPGGTVWTGVALESGTIAPRRFVGLLAGAITPRGQELHLWSPSSTSPERLPGQLVGSTQLRPGQLRVWRAATSIITVQAQLLDPVGLQPRTARVVEVYVTFDGKSGRGLTARTALLGGEQIVVDTTLAARWERVRRMAIRADSALGAGDLEKFGNLWGQLLRELVQAQRPR
jgi:hypothetical protein